MTKQTINSLPGADASFLSDLETFIRDEIVDREQIQGYPRASIFSGGIGAIDVSLTHTISACVGFPNSYYVSQDASSHTYTATKDTYVYLRDDDSRVIAISGYTITYDSNLVFAEYDSGVGSSQPTTPTGCLPLFLATSDGTSITSITDYRQIVTVIDPFESDQGVTATGSGRTLYDIAQDLSINTNATIIYQRDILFDTSIDLSSFLNLKLSPFHGAQIFQVTGDEIVTLYSPLNLSASPEQQITTDDCLRFSVAGKVYPKWWGAKGDDSTDDSVALNRFLSAAEGGTAYVTVGTYIGLNLAIKSNTHLTGEGFGSVLKTISTAEVDNSLLIAASASNITIENLKLDGNADNTVGSSASGITLLYLYGGCSNIIIQKNLLVDNNYVGIRITALDAGTGSSSDIVISNNIINNTDCGIITGHLDLQNLVISNNVIGEGTSEGISIWGHTDSKQGEKAINISNNIIYNKDGGGIQLRWANYVNVSCNNIHGCTSGIYLYPSSTYSSEVNIIGNTIDSCSGSGISGVVEDSVITSNIITSSGGCGIWLKDYSKNTIIYNNNVKNADVGDDDADAIRVEDSTNISVIGNTITDDSTYAYAGIRIQGATGLGLNCTVINNHVKDVETYGIYVIDVEGVQVIGNYVENSGTNYAVNVNVSEVITRNNWSDGVLWEIEQFLYYGCGVTALSLSAPTKLSTGSGALALTLADGAIRGQQKFISMSAAGNNADITIAHHETEDDEVARFDAIDEYLLLVWTGTEWATVANTCTFP
jgi:hypothetical protein